MSAPPAPPPRPVQLEVAALLWLLAAALGAAGALLGLAGLDAARERAVEVPGVDPRTARTVASLVVVGVVVLGVLAAALAALFAAYLRAGRPWARVLLTVFAAFGIGSTVYSLVAARSALAGLSGVLDVAAAVIEVLALVLMFAPASSGYLAHQR